MWRLNLSPNTFIRQITKFPLAMSEAAPILPGLSPVDGLDVHARFDDGARYSDGGVLVLRKIERKIGISDVLASCVLDLRDPVRTQRNRPIVTACQVSPPDLMLRRY